MLSSRKIKYRQSPAEYITHIYVEESCRDLPYTQDIIKRVGLPVEIIADQTSPAVETGLGPATLGRGKQHLLLCRNRGKFLKPCPGTREYLCCEYQVINIGMNCPMDCVYCILQAYLNNPWLTFFVNIDDLLAELREEIGAAPDRFWRIGTGEFTDSLALDRYTGLSRFLVNFMRDMPNAVLELKTKTSEIDNLAGLDHGGRTIVAWSLNSSAVMDREELRAASLEQRLAAAATCASWGYRLAFHFDPIIYHQDWKKGYQETISRLFEVVPADSIAWISMGALRFIPALKPIIVERFPNAAFFNEEFVPGLDGKSRYFRSLRTSLYQGVFEMLAQRVSPDTCIYLCMESNEVWREVFGFGPEEHGGLAKMLDRAAFPKDQVL